MALIIRQSNIVIPAGTRGNVNLFTNSFRGSYDCRVRFSFDNTVLGDVRPSGTTTTEGEQVSTGSSTGYTVQGTHRKVTIEVSREAAAGLPQFGLDNLSIIAVNEPDGLATY